MKSLMMVFGFAMVLISCKPALEEVEGADPGGQGAQGKVQAKDFTVRAGRTRLHPSGGKQWMIELHEIPNERPCEVSFPPEYTIDFAVSQEATGNYPLSASRRVAFTRHFASGMQASYAQVGQITITEINQNYVIGRLEAYFNDDNQTTGEFWAQICD